MKKVVVLIILSTLQSCLMPPTTQRFNPILESVEHEGEGVHGGMSYQDSIIQIKWNYTSTAFEFTLLNKTNKSLKVNWEESAYIDENGESNRVFHKGVKFADRSQTQPTTTVIRGSVLSDLIAPVDKVHYMSGQYGDWVISKNSISAIFLDGGDFFPEMLDLPQWSKVIATTNKSLDLPMVIDEVEELGEIDSEKCGYFEYENRHHYHIEGFKYGYNKAKETYQYTKNDMVQFAKWYQEENTEKKAEIYFGFSDLDMLAKWQEQRTIEILVK